MCLNSIMEGLSLLDDEELMLLLGSFFSLLFTCSFIYYFIKLFSHKMQYSEIPLFLLYFTYMNTLVWHYYSIFILHDYMKTCHQINYIIALIFIIIYILYEFKENKIDSFLNVGIIISVSWAIRKILNDILSDEDKVKISCGFSQLSLISMIFALLIKAYKDKNINILNVFCTFPLISVSVVWIVFGLVYEELAFFIPNILGLIMGCAYLGMWFYLKKKFYGFHEIKYVNIKNNNKDDSNSNSNSNSIRNNKINEEEGSNNNIINNK